MAGDAIAIGSFVLACQFLVDTVPEAFSFEWPWEWICKVLRSLPRRHKSEFVRVARLIGRLLGSASKAT